VKLFADVAESEFWLKKTEEEVGKYLSKNIDRYFLNELIENPFGASEVSAAGNLNTIVFLRSFRDYFFKREGLRNETFDLGDLSFSEKSVSYRNNDADKIIFCEGY